MKKKETIYALINDGIVENLIVAEKAFADTLKSQYDKVIVATDTVAYMGGEYIAGEFIQKPEPVPVPDVPV